MSKHNHVLLGGCLSLSHFRWTNNQRTNWVKHLWKEIPQTMSLARKELTLTIEQTPYQDAFFRILAFMQITSTKNARSKIWRDRQTNKPWQSIVKTTKSQVAQSPDLARRVIQWLGQLVSLIEHYESLNIFFWNKQRHKSKFSSLTERTKPDQSQSWLLSSSLHC